MLQPAMLKSADDVSELSSAVMPWQSAASECCCCEAQRRSHIQQRCRDGWLCDCFEVVCLEDVAAVSVCQRCVRFVGSQIWIHCAPLFQRVVVWSVSSTIAHWRSPRTLCLDTTSVKEDVRSLCPCLYTSISSTRRRRHVTQPNRANTCCVADRARHNG